MAQQIFVNRSGKPLRIHFDVKNITVDAILKLGHEIGAGGGDVSFDANKSDVLVVDPIHPCAFDEFLSGQTSDQRPPVVLAFWVPLCRISNELIWFNHPHWESVHLPHERLPYPHVPIGLKLYNCFLAGRQAASVPSSELAATAPELVARVILNTSDQEERINPASARMVALDKSSPERPSEAVIHTTLPRAASSTAHESTLSPIPAARIPDSRASSHPTPSATPLSSPKVTTSRTLSKRRSVRSGLKIVSMGNPQKLPSPPPNGTLLSQPSIDQDSATHAQSNSIDLVAVEQAETKDSPKASGIRLLIGRGPIIGTETTMPAIRNVFELGSKSVRDERSRLGGPTANTPERKSPSGLRITTTGTPSNRNLLVLSNDIPNPNATESSKSIVNSNGPTNGQADTTLATFANWTQTAAPSTPQSNSRGAVSLARLPAYTKAIKNNVVRFKSPVAVHLTQNGVSTQTKEALGSHPSLRRLSDSPSGGFTPSPGRQTPPPDLPEILAQSSSSDRRQWLRDDEYIINFMNWVFKQDPKASTAEIMLDIAKRLPHHSNDSWRRRFAAYVAEKYIHRVPILFERYHNKTSSIDPKVKSNSQSITPPGSQTTLAKSSSPDLPRQTKEPMPLIPVTPPELANSKKFTEEEDQFVMAYMNWWFTQDIEASTDEIMEDIALLLPRHSVSHWKARFRSLEDSKYMIGVPELFRRLTNRTSGPEAGLPASLDLALIRQRGDPNYAESSDEDGLDQVSSTKKRKTRRQSERYLDNRRERKKPRSSM